MLRLPQALGKRSFVRLVGPQRPKYFAPSGTPKIARHTEDEIAHGAYIHRAPAERMTVEAALKRYLTEVTPTKRAPTQVGEHKKAQVLLRHLGKYSLAALNH